MIDSFSELPKEKRPPEDIWFKAQELEEWFERVFEQRRDTTFHFTIDEVEG